jgi:hypothetical protein
MRSQHTIHTLTLFLLLSLGVAAQAFYDASFDAGPDGFTPVGLAFDADGAARNFAGWGLRSRIRSQSRGGAMTFQGPGGLAALRSSQIDLPTGQGGELYLSFHQYLNTLGGQIRVLVTNELGGVTDTTLVLNLAVGGETSSGSYHLLDLSDDMAGATVVAISIELTGGEANFWIIDDIQLSRTLPGPRGHRRSLTSWWQTLLPGRGRSYGQLCGAVSAPSSSAPAFVTSWKCGNCPVVSSSTR